MTVSNFLSLLCGLALFLYGVTLLGDGLKKVAGGRFETALYRFSDNPIKCVLLGAITTALIQSSTATSIIAIGFLNGGMMQLSQAAYTILGSILGSSVTGWIVSISTLGNGAGLAEIVSISNLIALVAVAGIILRKFRKKTSENNVGSLLLGFVILMTGMIGMTAAVEPLQTNETFISLIVSFSNPIIGMLIGIVFTTLIQSSSAAVGILQALSVTGVLTVSSSVPFILGSAIGAAAPVMLSTLGENGNAKRAAMLHLLMDLIGAILCGTVFYAVDAFSGIAFDKITVTPITIAAINTASRLVTVVALMPFVPLLEKLTVRIIRKTETDPSAGILAYLDSKFIPYPPLALAQCHSAVLEMAECASEGIPVSRLLLKEYDEALFKQMEEMEEKCDQYEDVIENYLMNIMRFELNQEEDVDATILMHAVSSFERISDYTMNIAHSLNGMEKRGINYSEEAQKELSVLYDAVSELVDKTREAFKSKGAEACMETVILAEVIDDLCKKMRLHHTRRLQARICTLEQGVSFNDTISNLENIADRCRKLAYMLLESAEGKIGVHDRFQNQKALETEESINTEKAYKEKFSLESA